MENAGARKISKSEDKIFTNIIQLKHAAEEHRHAYYLKKQILKLNVLGFEFFDPNSIIAWKNTQHYLHHLDIKVCRFLKKQFQLQGAALKYAAYLFVTYAIEVRADLLYPIYQELLSDHESKVNVKSIILEEEGHLEEMINQLEQFNSNWKIYADVVLSMEEKLFNEWLLAIKEELQSKQLIDNVLN